MSGISLDMTSITSAQVRAARVLLGWSASDLAKEAGVGTATVSRLEMSVEPLDTKRLSVRAIREALEAAGVRFTSQVVDGRSAVGVALLQKR